MQPSNTPVVTSDKLGAAQAEVGGDETKVSLRSAGGVAGGQASTKKVETDSEGSEEEEAETWTVAQRPDSMPNSISAEGDTNAKEPSVGVSNADGGASADEKSSVEVGKGVVSQLPASAVKSSMTAKAAVSETSGKREGGANKAANSEDAAVENAPHAPVIVNAAEDPSPTPGSEKMRAAAYKALLKDYSKLERPVSASNPDKTEVTVTVLFNKMWALSQKDMTYHANIRLILSWKDPNLAFGTADTGGSSVIVADASDLWTPPVFFKNAEKETVHMEEAAIKSDGTVKITRRISISLFAALKLAAFPFDTQDLDMELGVFGDMAQHVTFKLGTFSYNEETVGSSTWDFLEIEGKLESSNVLVTTVVIRRKIGNFFFKSFLPMTVIVLSSAGSFWIDPVAAVPARVAVCVTTMLTTISFYYTVTQELPRISMPTWMDVWVDASLFFVFLTLFEFIVVHMYRRVLLQQETHLRHKNSVGDDEADKLLRADHIAMKKAMLENSTGIWIDRFSRIWHPLGYALLNIILVGGAFVLYIYKVRLPW